MAAAGPVWLPVLTSGARVVDVVVTASSVVEVVLDVVGAVTTDEVVTRTVEVVVDDVCAEPGPWPTKSNVASAKTNVIPSRLIRATFHR